MPNVRASSGTIGTTRLAELLVAQQLRQQPHEHHRRRRLAAFGALVELLEELARHACERLAAHLAARHVAAERLAALAHVLDFDAVFGRAVERRVLPISASEIGMPKRVRNARSSSSFIFFCWCVMFLPSPASPRP